MAPRWVRRYRYGRDSYVIARATALQLCLDQRIKGTWNMKQRHRFVLYAAIVLAFSIFPALLVVRHIRMTNDSMRYAMVAEHLRKGRGLRTHMFSITATPDASGTVPFTIQPPLLPLLLAGVGGVSPDRVWPAQILNVISHVITSMCTFFIAWRLSRTFFAVFAGVSVAVALSLLHITGHVWSDAPFVAFFMATVALLQASRTARRRQLCLLGSSLLAVAAFLTRYLGLAILPLFLWESLLTWRSRGLAAGTKAFLITVTFPVLCVAAVFLRNIAITGNIGGFPLELELPADRAHLAALWYTIRMIGTGNLGVSSGLRATFVCGGAGIVIIIWIALLRHWRSQKRRLYRHGLDVLLIGGLSYLLVLVHGMSWWATTGDKWVIESRYCAPLTPLIVVVVIFGIGESPQLVHSSGLKRPVRLLATLLAASLTLYLAADSFERIRRKSEEDSIRNTGTYRWLKEHCPQGTVIATNKPFETAFLAGWPSLRLPSRAYYPFAKVPEDMDKLLPRKMSHIRCAYVVLFADRGGLADEHVGPFIASLSRRETPTNLLRMVYEDESGVVFSLHESTVGTVGESGSRLIKPHDRTKQRSPLR